MNLDPSVACPHPAGSPAKLAVLRERVAKRQPLFHPDDNPAIAGKLSCPIPDDALLDAMRLYAPIETVALREGRGSRIEDRGKNTPTARSRTRNPHSSLLDPPTS